MALTDNRESRPWAPTRIALLGYGFATAVGFIHAQAYYGAFDIDILNYISPIDLLFISLDHIDKVLAVTFTIVPVVLVSIAVGLPTFLFLLFVILVVVTSSVAITLLMVGALSIDAGLNGVRSIKNRVKWLREAIRQTWRDRMQRSKAKAEAQRTEESSQGSGRPVIREPIRLVVAYRDAMKSSTLSKRDEMVPYIKKAEAVISAVPKAIDWLVSAWLDLREKRIPRWRVVYFEQGPSLRLKPLTALKWGPRLVVLSLSAFLLCSVAWAAWRTGRVDALLDEKRSVITSWPHYAETGHLSAHTDIRM